MPTIVCQDFADGAAEEYWTEERMAEAQPVPVPPSGLPTAMDGDGAATTDVAADMVVPAGMPDSIEPRPVEPSAVSPGVPQPAPNPPEYHVPFWNCGKLFFSNQAGQNFQCSASFVASPNLLMTAAHCIIDLRTGAWNKNFKFVRAYAGSSSGPQVVYPKRICMYQEVFANNRFNALYDYAFASTYQASGAGWLGFCLPPAVGSTITNVGYPACFGGDPLNPDCVGGGGRIPNPSDWMYWVNGQLGSPTGKGMSQMLQNPMQRGNSGGPWIYKFSTETSAGGNNMAMGLTSLGSSPNSNDGPPFNMDTYNLLMHVLQGAG